MLFNSPEFMFLFLPFTILIFFLIGHFNRILSLTWLSIASILFYGYWDWHYLPLITGSILLNYFIGRGILVFSGYDGFSLKKLILFVGVLCDLLLLSYYKYIDFFITVINKATHSDHSLMGIILPLGISFFTFTQIAYLVDCYKGKVGEYSFIKYILFVTYFPHLIAGPILHHQEMIPQFSEEKIFKPQRTFAAGLAMFTIGLFKKVFFADSIAVVANSIFNAAHAGDIVTADAWIGTLAYTLQIYFDFSGYSDMAIGLSMLFGVRLPANFYSPYKSTNIIDFWRRWHMTLSRFLRDYLYIPLGGNQKGLLRRYLNLIITMLLGGFWHGAGWTYIFWGALHGSYLSINHAWRYFCKKYQLTLHRGISQPVSLLLTFFCVMIAWVFFRAPNMKTAFRIIRCMFGSQVGLAHVQSVHILLFNKLLIGLLLVCALLLPNSLQIISRYDIVLDNPASVDIVGRKWYQWRLSSLYAIITGLLFTMALLGVLTAGDGAEFLYFEF